MTVFIGIDPGVSGAVASIDIYGSVRVADLPTKPMEWVGMGKSRIDLRALVHLLREMFSANEAVVVAVERVGIMKPQGNAIASVGSLCGSAALILGALDILRIQPLIASPTVWKKDLGLVRAKATDDAPKETASAWKKRSLVLARSLYPEAKGLELAKSVDRAEALLLAHWAMEQTN